MRRSELFESICASVGNPPLKPVRAGDGWPGLAVLSAGSKSIPIAMHVSQVGTHHRKEYELRFQNPGDRRPVTAPIGSIPVLIGLAGADQPILVVVAGESRVDRVARFSILFHKSLVIDALKHSWAEYVSSTGEQMFAMHPKLFPTFIEALSAKVLLSPEDVVGVAEASGLIEEPTDEAAERVRRMASRLVRSAKFSKIVRNAYDHRCAMCGLSLGLVAGAHILPVSAEGSKDVVWNGMALCHNHHAAFDRHYLWVHPQSHTIIVDPNVAKIAESDVAAKTFVENTRKQLMLPQKASLSPRAEMFEQRYQFYEGLYNWI